MPLTKLVDQRLLIEAMNHLLEGIRLLDLSGAPGHIAANIDLSVNQIEDVISPETRWRRARLNETPDGVETILAS